jgi:cytochrome c
MIGDTITVTFNGVATTLTRINQDNYSSEYYLLTATVEWVMKVRHQDESARVGMPQYVRHHVDLTRKEFDAVNGDKIFQSYTVIRHQKGGDPAVARNLTLALNGFQTSAILDKVMNRES